jgi:hypothetical protein
VVSEKGRRTVGNADQAHENSEYVRRLLKKKRPEFAAVLEHAVWELTRCPERRPPQAPLTSSRPGSGVCEQVPVARTSYENP